MDTEGMNSSKGRGWRCKYERGQPPAPQLPAGTQHTHLTLDRPQIGVPRQEKMTLVFMIDSTHTPPSAQQFPSCTDPCGGPWGSAPYLTPGSSCCWVMSSESSSEPPYTLEGRTVRKAEMGMPLTPPIHTNILHPYVSPTDDLAYFFM